MSEAEFDQFELGLEKKIQELKACQSASSYSSCSQCEKILGCGLRKEYVKAVYRSMDKGSTGDFSF